MKRAGIIFGCGILGGLAAGGLAAVSSFRIFDPVAAAMLMASAALLGSLADLTIARHPRWMAGLCVIGLAAVFWLPPEPLLRLPLTGFMIGVAMTALPVGRTAFAVSAGIAVLGFAAGVPPARSGNYDLWLLWLAVPGMLWGVQTAFRKRALLRLPLIGLLLATAGVATWRDMTAAEFARGCDRLGDWYSRIVVQEPEKSLRMHIFSGGRRYVLPDHLNRFVPAMLPAVLQSPETAPSVLLVADAPLALMPELTELTGAVALLSDCRRPLAPFYAVDMEKIPVFWSLEEFFAAYDPASPYDVIMVLELPAVSPAARERLLARFRRCLAPDGALVTPRSLQPEAVPLPGNPEMTVSGGAIAPDFAALGARLAARQPESALPPLLETLYTFRPPEILPERPAPKAGMRIFAALRSRLPDWPPWVIPAILLAVFWGIRLWFGRGVVSGMEWRVFAGGAAVMTAGMGLTIQECDNLLMPGMMAPTALIASVMVFAPWRTVRGGGHPKLLLAVIVLLAAIGQWWFPEDGRAALLLPAAAVLDRWRTPAPAGFEWSPLHYLGLLAGVVIFVLLPPGTGLWFAAGLLLPDLLYRPRRRRMS